jgi:phosphoglycolate phosphatase-like HAD superfamily hydrolase|eukprot:jgi/Chrpa1/1180/Chrysochromulina_OHIO_Genome00012732-RA
MSDRAELKIRALVLDFDSTISTPRYIERLQEWAVADKVQIFEALTPDEHIENLGGQERIDALKALLLELSEAGVTLFIISIGYRVALMPQLETAGLLRFFADNRVYGQDSPELRQLGFVKGRLIERIMNHHGWGRDDVLFVDDSMEHIDRASTVCKTLLVPPEAKKAIGGMRQVEFDAIRTHAFGEGPETAITTAVI